MKKFGKEHIYLDKNGEWIDFSDGLIAESEAKGLSHPAKLRTMQN